MNILVTGAAGFIGHALCKRLLTRGDTVVGIDNLNAYYSVQLKTDRLLQLQASSRFYFSKTDLSDRSTLDYLCETHQIEVVVNLAAQAGVRYSLEHPDVYIHSNLVGFGHILELCRHHPIKQLVFASSSSVYGANTTYPFSEKHQTDHPVSLYAATKKSNELMAHAYASLYGIPTTGLRFFTVYGPWGRPDMALFKFTEHMLKDEPIEVYNNGHMYRDFTYIDDIVGGIVAVIDHPAVPNPAWKASLPDSQTSYAPYRIYNLGDSAPVLLSEVITMLEKALNKKAVSHYLPQQSGDVVFTHADMEAAKRDFNLKFEVSIEEGISRFVAWYRHYFNI